MHRREFQPNERAKGGVRVPGNPLEIGDKLGGRSVRSMDKYEESLKPGLEQVDKIYNLSKEFWASKRGSVHEIRAFTSGVLPISPDSDPSVVENWVVTVPSPDVISAVALGWFQYNYAPECEDILKRKSGLMPHLLFANGSRPPTVWVALKLQTRSVSTQDVIDTSIDDSEQDIGAVVAFTPMYALNMVSIDFFCTFGKYSERRTLALRLVAIVLEMCYRLGLRYAVASVGNVVEWKVGLADTLGFTEKIYLPEGRLSSDYEGEDRLAMSRQPLVVSFPRTSRTEDSLEDYNMWLDLWVRQRDYLYTNNYAHAIPNWIDRVTPKPRQDQAIVTPFAPNRFGLSGIAAFSWSLALRLCESLSFEQLILLRKSFATDVGDAMAVGTVGSKSDNRLFSEVTLSYAFDTGESELVAWLQYLTEKREVGFGLRDHIHIRLIIETAELAVQLNSFTMLLEALATIPTLQIGDVPIDIRNVANEFIYSPSYVSEEIGIKLTGRETAFTGHAKDWITSELSLIEDPSIIAMIYLSMPDPWAPMRNLDPKEYRRTLTDFLSGRLLQPHFTPASDSPEAVGRLVDLSARREDIPVSDNFSVISYTEPTLNKNAFIQSAVDTITHIDLTFEEEGEEPSDMEDEEIEIDILSVSEESEETEKMEEDPSFTNLPRDVIVDTLFTDEAGDVRKKTSDKVRSAEQRELDIEGRSKKRSRPLPPTFGKTPTKKKKKRKKKVKKPKRKRGIHTRPTKKKKTRVDGDVPVPGSLDVGIVVIDAPVVEKRGRGYDESIFENFTKLYARKKKARQMELIKSLNVWLIKKLGHEESTDVKDDDIQELDRDLPKELVAKARSAMQKRMSSKRSRTWVKLVGLVRTLLDNSVNHLASAQADKKQEAQRIHDAALRSIERWLRHNMVPQKKKKRTPTKPTKPTDPTEPMEPADVPVTMTEITQGQPALKRLRRAYYAQEEFVNRLIMLTNVYNVLLTDVYGVEEENVENYTFSEEEWLGTMPTLSTLRRYIKTEEELKRAPVTDDDLNEYFDRVVGDWADAFTSWKHRAEEAGIAIAVRKSALDKLFEELQTKIEEYQTTLSDFKRGFRAKPDPLPVGTQEAYLYYLFSRMLRQMAETWTEEPKEPEEPSEPEATTEEGGEVEHFEIFKDEQLDALLADFKAIVAMVGRREDYDTLDHIAKSLHDWFVDLDILEDFKRQAEDNPVERKTDVDESMFNYKSIFSSDETIVGYLDKLFGEHTQQILDASKPEDDPRVSDKVIALRLAIITYVRNMADDIAGWFNHKMIGYMIQHDEEKMGHQELEETISSTRNTFTNGLEKILIDVGISKAQIDVDLEAFYGSVGEEEQPPEEKEGKSGSESMEDLDASRRDVLRLFDKVRAQLKRGGEKKLNNRQRMMLLAALMDIVSSAPGGPREMMDKFHPGWQDKTIISIPSATSAGWGVAYGRLANMVRQRMKDFTLSVVDLYIVGESFKEVSISDGKVNDYVGKLRTYIEPFIGRMTNTYTLSKLQIRLTTLAHIIDAADNESRMSRANLVTRRSANFGWDSFHEEDRFEKKETEEHEEEEEEEEPPWGDNKDILDNYSVIYPPMESKLEDLSISARVSRPSRPSRPKKLNFAQIMREHVDLTIKYVKQRVKGGVKVSETAKTQLIGQIQRWKSPFLKAWSNVKAFDSFAALLETHIVLVDKYLTETINKYKEEKELSARDVRLPLDWGRGHETVALVGENMDLIAEALATAISKGETFAWLSKHPIATHDISFIGIRNVVRDGWSGHIACTVRYINAFVNTEDDSFDIYSKQCIDHGQTLGGHLDAMVKRRKKNKSSGSAIPYNDDVETPLTGASFRKTPVQSVCKEHNVFGFL